MVNEKIVGADELSELLEERRAAVLGVPLFEYLLGSASGDVWVGEF